MSLTSEEINTRLEKYDAWALDEDTGKLLAGFEFEEFDQAIDFVNNIAEIAKQVGHHPDMLLHDAKFVTVFTSTHDADQAITDRDFDLIEAIETEITKSQEDHHDHDGHNHDGHNHN